jgi:hypothetical protein
LIDPMADALVARWPDESNSHRHCHEGDEQDENRDQLGPN